MTWKGESLFSFLSCHFSCSDSNEYLFFWTPKRATRAALMEHLESCLRHRSEIVVYEAAKAICFLKNATAKELIPAVSGECHYTPPPAFCASSSDLGLFFLVISSSTIPDLPEADPAVRGHPDS